MSQSKTLDKFSLIHSKFVAIQRFLEWMSVNHGIALSTLIDSDRRVAISESEIYGFLFQFFEIDREQFELERKALPRMDINGNPIEEARDE